MMFVAAWSAYADMLAGDPIIYAVSGVVIALIMFAMAFPTTSTKTKKD